MIATTGCASFPEPKQKWFTFPKEAYIGRPSRSYEVIGTVKSRVDYQTLDSEHDELKLCSNYFNSAVKKLVAFAKEKGGDAVMDVRSVVFLLDGKVETHKTPECSDDGGEGQVLAQGTAIRWLDRF